MSFTSLHLGDIVVATSLVLKLIKRLQENDVLEEYSMESRVYFAIMVEVKDLMAASPEAIPASARAALELVEHRQELLTALIKEYGLASSHEALEKFRNVHSPSSVKSFLFNSRANSRYDELEKMLESWKSAVSLLRQVTVDSITHNLLRHRELLGSNRSITPGSAQIEVTIAIPTDGTHKEIKANGILDTGSRGVWVTQKLLEDADLAAKICPILEKTGPFAMFNGDEYEPKHQIDLKWYPSHDRSQDRVNTFLVCEKGPFEVLFGIDYVESLSKPKPKKLPTLLLNHKNQIIPPKRKTDSWKKLEKAQEAQKKVDKPIEDEFDKEERMKREHHRKIAGGSTPNATKPAPAVAEPSKLPPA